MERCQKLKQKQITELKQFIKDKDSTKKEVRRAQAIMMIDKDISVSIIQELTGYSRRNIFDLRKRYLKDGISVINDPARNNPKELLSKKQRDEIIETIKSKKPEDVGFHSSYWTTAILGEYIKIKYKVKYKSRTSFYLIFRQANFTFHKPGRVYEKRDEEEVEKWQKKAKRKLKKVWKEKDTVILCEDEMILSTQTTFQKIWLPANEYPKIEVSNTKKNRSVYGFLNIRTGKEHAFKTEKQNMHITTGILKKIRKIYPKRKIFLLWDGAGWHRGSAVQEFIKKDANIEILHFPKYSPDENPQEHVWKDGRDKVTHNNFIKNIDTTTDDFVKYLKETKFPYKLLGFSAVLE